MRSKPASRSSACTASAWSKPCSSSSQPPASVPAGAARDDGAPGLQPPSGRASTPCRLGRQRRQVWIGCSDVGRVAEREVEAALRRPATSCPGGTRRSRPSRVALVLGDARPHSGIGGRDRADGQACLTASAIAPLPVPMSSTAGCSIAASSPRSSSIAQSTRYLGIGPRHEHARVDLQRQAVELGARRAGKATGSPARRRAISASSRAACSPDSGHRRARAARRGRGPARGRAAVAHRAAPCRGARRECLAERLHCAPPSSAASCSAARAACSAAITSSRSPSTIACSL